MENPKVLVSFVERGGPEKPSAESPVKSQLFALSSDGKRLIRLQPEQLQPARKCQLIGLLTEKPAEITRKQIRIEPKPSGACGASAAASAATGVALQLRLAQDVAGLKPEDEAAAAAAAAAAALKQKIPRPANAFMLFANEWRKKLAAENPRESNKDISVRLGLLWKTMSKELKEKYFGLAREVDAEHKRKYPDYVYNPKEARLRKAMRDQSREQHPSAHRALQQQQPAGGGAGEQSGGAQRPMLGPWFPARPPPPPPLPPSAGASAAPGPPAAHPKPVLSARVMAGHQRALDKTKDLTRKQQLDCVATEFSAGPPAASYPADYPAVGHGAQDAPDYCALNDYSDAQKWHPYQNGMGAYHSRSALMSKMNSLHRGMPSVPATAASHATSPWGQFCNVPFPPSQSALMRSNRHMVFLQEQQQQQQQQQQRQSQQPQQHCGYSAEMQLSPYEAKVQDDVALRLHSSFPQEEAQVKSPAQEESRRPCANESPGWAAGKHEGREPEAPGQPTDPQQQQQQQQHHQPPSSGVSNSKNSVSSSRQPLPGFQQAFGSTEIGKFSRSELFASLVEAASNLIPPEGPLKSCSDTTPSSSPPFSSKQAKEDVGKPKAAQWAQTATSSPAAVYASPLLCSSENRSRLSPNLLMGASLDCHGACDCTRLARPTDADKTAALQSECLDLRVPARKRFKEENS